MSLFFLLNPKQSTMIGDIPNPGLADLHKKPNALNAVIKEPRPSGNIQPIPTQIRAKTIPDDDLELILLMLD